MPDSSLSANELLLYSNATGIFLLNKNEVHRFLNEVSLSPAPICEKAELQELAKASTRSCFPCAFPSAHGIVVPPYS